MDEHISRFNADADDQGSAQVVRLGHQCAPCYGGTSHRGLRGCAI